MHYSEFLLGSPNHVYYDARILLPNSIPFFPPLLILKEPVPSEMIVLITVLISPPPVCFLIDNSPCMVIKHQLLLFLLWIWNWLYWALGYYWWNIFFKGKSVLLHLVQATYPFLMNLVSYPIFGLGLPDFFWKLSRLPLHGPWNFPFGHFAYSLEKYGLWTPFQYVIRVLTISIVFKLV